MENNINKYDICCLIDTNSFAEIHTQTDPSGTYNVILSSGNISFAILIKN